VLFLSMVAAVIVPLMSVVVKHYGLGVFVAKPPTLESPSEYRISPGGPEATGVQELPTNRGALKGICIGYDQFARTHFSMAPGSAVRLVHSEPDSDGSAGSDICAGIRLLNHAKPLACEKIRQAVHLANARLGISKNVEVYSSEKIHSPVIWCWSRRPILLVSSTAGDRAIQ